LEQTDHGHLRSATHLCGGSRCGSHCLDQPRDSLNRYTTDKIDFFAVALEAIRIGDSKPAVVFRLAASPNAWTKTVSSMQASQITSLGSAYQTFYQVSWTN
jgi:hypothetical protein